MILNVPEDEEDDREEDDRDEDDREEDDREEDDRDEDDREEDERQVPIHWRSAAAAATRTDGVPRRVPATMSSGEF